MRTQSKRPLGFISEHTAEFVLVPKLTQLLSQHFSNITPIYYWASREGSNLNKAAFNDDLIKVLVLFPRRPKVTKDLPSNIFVKFNELLFERCRSFHGHGVPVIAGLPLASRLEDIHSQTRCMWFRLMPDGTETVEMIQLSNPVDIHVAGVRSIPETEIIDILKKQAVMIRWPKFCEIIKVAQLEQPRSWFTFFGSYKPIYFIVRA